MLTLHRLDSIKALHTRLSARSSPPWTNPGSHRFWPVEGLVVPGFRAYASAPAEAEPRRPDPSPPPMCSWLPPFPSSLLDIHLLNHPLNAICQSSWPPHFLRPNCQTCPMSASLPPPRRPNRAEDRSQSQATAAHARRPRFLRRTPPRLPPGGHRATNTKSLSWPRSGC